MKVQRLAGDTLGKTLFQQQSLNMQTRLIECSRVAPSERQSLFFENEDRLGLGALSADGAGGLLTWGIRHSGLPLRCWKGAQIELVHKSRISFHRCRNVFIEAYSRLASRDRQHWLNEPGFQGLATRYCLKSKQLSLWGAICLECCLGSWGLHQQTVAAGPLTWP